MTSARIKRKKWRCVILGVLVVLKASLAQGSPGCPECLIGHYVQDNGHICGICTTCSPGTYNTHRGRATHCAPCRLRCFDDIQIKVKSCAPDHDIVCKCPAGKSALTQEDMCYDAEPSEPGKERGQVSQSPSTTINLKGSGGQKDIHPETQTKMTTVPSKVKDGKESSALGSNTSRNVLIAVGIVSSLLIITILVTVIKCRHKLCRRIPTQLRQTFVRQYSNEDKEQVHVQMDTPRQARGPQTKKQSLQAVFMNIAENLPVNDWKMFLRSLPEPNLKDTEIDDIEKNNPTTRERVYKALTKWKERNTAATHQDLIDTLVKCKHNALAQELAGEGQVRQDEEDQERGDGVFGGNDSGVPGTANNEAGESDPLLSVDCTPSSVPSTTNYPSAPTVSCPIPASVDTSGGGPNKNDRSNHATPGSPVNEPNQFESITKQPICETGEGGTKNPDLIGELSSFKQEYGASFTGKESPCEGANDAPIQTTPKEYAYCRDGDDPTY